MIALLDASAEVDGRDEHGNTPLLNAVFNSRGNGDAIDLARSRRADPYAPNAHGQTPLGLARLIANYDVARYFSDLP
jgi:ankyrin repeat protein